MAQNVSTPFNEYSSKNTEEAARFLGVTPHVMIRWRHERRGPAYIKLARNLVRYRLSDLADFVEEHRVVGGRGVERTK